MSDIFSSLYRSLGVLAPTLSDDTFVVCVHEMSRHFGRVALDVREFTNDAPHDVEVIDEVLRLAVERDESGALLLYAMSMVLGPRLLVSLRDAAIEIDDERAAALCARAQEVALAQVLAIGALVERRAPIANERFGEDARELVRVVENSGNVDSFGISR